MKKKLTHKRISYSAHKHSPMFICSPIIYSIFSQTTTSLFSKLCIRLSLMKGIQVLFLKKATLLLTRDCSVPNFSKLFSSSEPFWSKCVRCPSSSSLSSSLLSLTFHVFICFSRTTGTISTKLAQSILGWKEFEFVQMKGPVLFQEDIITN